MLRSPIGFLENEASADLDDSTVVLNLLRVVEAAARVLQEVVRYGAGVRVDVTRRAVQSVARIRVIERVERLEPQLEREPLGYASVLEDTEVHLVQQRTEQARPRHVAEWRAKQHGGARPVGDVEHVVL